MQHDHHLRLERRRTKKTFVIEKVTWKSSLGKVHLEKFIWKSSPGKIRLRGRSLENGNAKQGNVRQRTVAAHRESHIASVPDPEFASGCGGFWQNPDVAGQANPCAVR